jgi:Superinfection immunity protein
MQGLISLWLIGMLIVVMVTAYMLPTLVACLRHAPDAAAVAVLNAVLGWTVIGWIVALALALRKPASPVVQVISQVASPPPGGLANGYYWGPPYAGNSLAPAPKPEDLPDIRA